MRGAVRFPQVLGLLTVVSACAGSPSAGVSPATKPSAAPAANVPPPPAKSAASATTPDSLSSEELRKFVQCYSDCTVLKPLTPAVIAALDARAVELRDATFQFSRASHLQGIDGLPWIRRMWINTAEPIDFAPVAKLKNLEQLLLFAPDAKSLERLAELRELRVLNLSVTSNKSLAPLSKLTKLETLNLGALEAEDPDLSALAELVELTSFELTGGPKVNDVSALRKLPKLRVVSLYGTPLTNLSSLSGHPAIERLSLSIAPKGAIDSLGTFPKLAWLTVRDMEVKDISGVGKATSLTALELIGLGVTKLPTLASLKKLRTLYLGQMSSLTDLGGLSGLPELTGLSLSQTGVKQLGALAGLPKLEELELEATPVSDLSPLVKIKTLRRVRVHGATPDTIAFRKLRPDVAADNLLTAPAP